MRRGWAFVGSVCALLFAASAGLAQDEQIITRWDGTHAADVRVPLSALSDEPTATPPADALPPAGSQGSLRSGRSPAALPAGEWVTRWSAPRERAFAPVRLLRSGERVVSQATVWELFDPSGRPVARGRSQAPLSLGEAELLGVDAKGFLSSWSAAKGELRWRLSPNAAGARWDLIWRRGERLILAGDEALGDPRERVSVGLVYAVTVGPNPKLDRRKRVRNAPGATLRLGPGPLFAAARTDTMVVALPRRIYAIDEALSVRLGLRAAFTPRGLALDEGGRAHLVAHTDAGLRLWVLSPAGKRVANAPLPGADGERQLLIAYDHRVVVLGDRRLVCFDPSGKLLWKAEAQALAGGSVTASGQVLTSEGSELAAYDASGARRVLASFTGEILLTAPLLAADGAIYVASRQRVHALSVR